MFSFYRRDTPSGKERFRLAGAGAALDGLRAEWCFYVSPSAPLTAHELGMLRWLLAETFDPDGLCERSFLKDCESVIEVGPQLHFETPWASNARAICARMGLLKVARIERSRRLGFERGLGAAQRARAAELLHDRMTEAVYEHPLQSFGSARAPERPRIIGVLAGGIDALREANERFGLAMDEHDLRTYHELFATRLRRDPTDVELFQLGQGNSEHCRHGFFRGNLVLDGEALPASLMGLVKAPYKANPNNSIIAFNDDSSAIAGREIPLLVPSIPGAASAQTLDRRTYHPTLTAETHNHPTGVAPYPGAATGGGGRIRDNECVGRGGLTVASGAAYCVANLHIPGYELPWEADGREHPSHLASPLEILIEASNGASDYGNCFGEPVVLGHARTAGLPTPSGYRAYYKPIMYSEGVGLIDARHVGKAPPAPGMLVVQIGGPAYRIGMGGGAASSLMSGENAAHLDFDSVQRGDPEMAQRSDRVIAACIALGERNPILSAHDYGAGGASNAVTEILDPSGGRVELAAMARGDESLSALEVWGCEAQERNVFLMDEDGYERFAAICEREGCPVAQIATVTGDGRLVVSDADGSEPVNLPLADILGELPPRTIELRTVAAALSPLSLPGELTVAQALERVLRLPAVASKRYLTVKVDRSVTGLVAQQQCVGPYETPLADYAVLAHSLLASSGTAVSQGERPLIGLIDPAAQARMSVAEALLNLAGARITALRDVRCSANWMWAAKLDGEGARLHGAAQAMSEMMCELGIAIDGGKDSLTMAVLHDGETVKAPGQLVIAPYAVMDDVAVKLTPDLKAEGDALLLLDLSGGLARLGGSALAQCYGQLGDQCPDVADAGLLARAFDAVQELLVSGSLQAVHDRSDGGLISCLVEMAIAGDRGISVCVKSAADALAALFCEGFGLVLEVAPQHIAAVAQKLCASGVPYTHIGIVGEAGGEVQIHVNGERCLSAPVHELRFAWEETSSRLDELQANPECVAAELSRWRAPLKAPSWELSFEPARTAPERLADPDAPAVCVLREEGTNGDGEMRAALYGAGFRVYDANVRDLLAGDAHLEDFRGLVFPGGFSFGDTLDSAKGWAAAIRYHEALAAQFERFYERADTFSLGVCNGAQLMALLGWAPFAELPDERRPRFIKNASGRFESRTVTVEVLESPAVMLRGMAGSRLGVWVAHGEGRLHVPDAAVMARILSDGLAPLRFLDDDGHCAESYPHNPNGSPHGITALCSPDGRHLAMMPHPERLANALWQWPYLPRGWERLAASPWLRMFQNARGWCAER